MEGLIRLYRSKLINRLLHTPLYCLQRELKGCSSVLDLGCGPDSPIQYCGIARSFGVDIFKPFMETSQNKRIHQAYLIADVSTVHFADKSFDAVALIEILEHLTKEKGALLLEKVETWARKKVIITTPNGYLPQGILSENPYEIHRSGWSVDELKRRAYKAYGISGWKFLRKENTAEGFGVSGNAMFSTLRFRPYLFWIIVSGLSQLFTYYFPRFAFEVFYVKNLKEEKRQSK